MPAAGSRRWRIATPARRSAASSRSRGLLKFIKERAIRNVVWITADVHYCAAHRYSPNGAGFTEFDPFWEFVGGPLHAGTFGPSELDRTFGPDVKFIGIPPGMKPNRPPSEPYQFFGSGRIDRADRRADDEVAQRQRRDLQRRIAARASSLRHPKSPRLSP